MFCRKTVHSLSVAWSLYCTEEATETEGRTVVDDATGTGTAESARNSWRRHLVSHHLAGSRTAVRLPRHHATPHDRPASSVHCLPRPRSLLYLYSTLLYCVIHRSLVTVPARHCGTDAAWNRGRSNKADVPETTALEIHGYLLGCNRKNI